MSVLALALKRLEELSHGTVPKECPNGTPPAQRDLNCPNGTSLSTVPAGHLRDSGTNGTVGTVGTPGTLGTADRRSVALPASLRERVQQLNSYPCPEGFSPERWERLRESAVRFAAEWADKALSLGWTHDEIFAVGAPFANVSRRGVAWLIADSTATAVTADAITLRRTSGSVTRIYREIDRELRGAIAFLEAELANGPRNAVDLDDKAEGVGITREALARARARLGVVTRQPPGCPRTWRLPKAGSPIYDLPNRPRPGSRFARGYCSARRERQAP